MTELERSEEPVEPTDASLDGDQVEAAPAGAASKQAPAAADDQRQRSDAAAAYAAAAQGAPARMPAAADTAADGRTPPDEAEPASPEDEAEDQATLDLDELTARAQRADEYLALAQRTQADFENFRKRAAREAAAAQERGVAKLVKELLPVIDNLDRALKAAAADDESQLAVGIRLVHSDLLAALSRLGVEPFSPDGEQFDPQLHEAVAQQPVDGLESGLVAEVFQQGFRLGESVLRPARVLVAA